MTRVPAAERRRGDGDHCADWIQAFCRITKDSVAGSAGQALHLRSWQREELRHLLARRRDGRFRHRQALIGKGRKNGKSTEIAGLGLYGLLSDYPEGPQGREVYSCAGDKDQAKIVFGTARRMIELEPELGAVTRLYRDAIEVPETGSVYRVLSAEAYTKEGLNPSLVLFDEPHVQPNRELWEVMALAMGARPEPLMVGITTAGVRYDSSGKDSLCFQLYEYGCRVASGEIEDPTFFFAWWEPQKLEADYLDPATWRQSNPGYGDLVAEEDFRATALRTPEAEFRIKRCNQWVVGKEAWLPEGAWTACAQEREIPAGAEVVLGFDGSFNNDCTALVVCEIARPSQDEADSLVELHESRPPHPHLEVVELWEAPPLDQYWRVPIIEVEDAIRAACKRWSVKEIACDPARWSRTYQVLEAEGLPVVEFPQSPQRMTPATQHFYEAVINKQLTHSGDLRLARHIANAIYKVDSRGSRIYKESKNSSRKIDLAIAALMAFERAYWWSQQAPEGMFAAWR